MDIPIVKILVQLVWLAVTRLSKSDTLNSNSPLLRSYTIATTYFLESGQFYLASMDHKAQDSFIVTHHSLMAGNAPQGPQILTRGGVGPKRL